MRSAPEADYTPDALQDSHDMHSGVSKANHAEPLTAEEARAQFADLKTRYDVAVHGDHLALDHSERKALIKGFAELDEAVEKAAVKPLDETKRALGIKDEDAYLGFLDGTTMETHGFADRIRTTLDEVRKSPETQELRALLPAIKRIRDELRIYKFAAYQATSAE